MRARRSPGCPTSQLDHQGARSWDRSFAQSGGTGFVDRSGLGIDDDAIDLRGGGGIDQIVAPVLEHAGRCSLARVTVPGARWADDPQHIACLHLASRHFRRPMLFVGPCRVVDQRRAQPVAPSENAARGLEYPVAVAGKESIRQKAHIAHVPAAAPVSPGAGRLRPQLVTLYAQRIGKLNLLARDVARISHEIIDRVEAVLGGSSAVAAFVDLDANPVLAPCLIEAGERDAHHGGRIARCHLVRHYWCECTNDAINYALDLSHTGEARTREARVENRAK